MRVKKVVLLERIGRKRKIDTKLFVRLYIAPIMTNIEQKAVSDKILEQLGALIRPIQF